MLLFSTISTPRMIAIIILMPLFVFVLVWLLILKLFVVNARPILLAIGVSSSSSQLLSRAALGLLRYLTSLFNDAASSVSPVKPKV
jgi:hypothetical protein